MSLSGLSVGYRALAGTRWLVCLLVLVLAATAGLPAMGQTAPPSLTLTKDGVLNDGGDGIANPGDLIDYTFMVLNQDVECDITNLTVTDSVVSTITCPSGNPIPLLVAGGTAGSDETCTGSYAITQADIDAGFVDNEASADGWICAEVPIQATDTHSTPIEQVPDIELVKAGILDLGGDGVATPGDMIDYELAVTNLGNVTLTDVVPSDPSLPGLSCPSGIPIPSLAPGASETCTGSIAIDQDDIDAGFVENSAEVTASDPTDPVPTSTTTRAVVAQAMVQVMIPQQPIITLDKTGTANFGADGAADPGDTIDYVLMVENPGNVTLINLAVSDPLLGTVTCPSGNPIPTLAPGASETCTGGYTITAADITAGSVPNTAQVVGQDPRQQAVANDDTETVDLPARMPTAGFWWLVALALALATMGGLALRRQRASG